MLNRATGTCLALVFSLALAACGTDTPSASDDTSNPEASPAGDDTAGDDTVGTDSGEEASVDPDGPEAEEAAPRLDPLPIPADLDQVVDVFQSLLGPTDDFVAQVRRIDPDYLDLPTPEGAEIVGVSVSFHGGEDLRRKYRLAVMTYSSRSPG